MGFTPVAENHLPENLVRCSSESYCTALQQKERTDVRFGSKADMDAILLQARSDGLNNLIRMYRVWRALEFLPSFHLALKSWEFPR
jgi:hypothetical protein